MEAEEGKKRSDSKIYRHTSGTKWRGNLGKGAGRDRQR